MVNLAQATIRLQIFLQIATKLKVKLMYTLVLFGLIHLTKKGLQLKENNNMKIVRKPFTIKYFLKDTYYVPV